MLVLEVALSPSCDRSDFSRQRTWGGGHSRAKGQGDALEAGPCPLEGMPGEFGEMRRAGDLDLRLSH